MIDPALSFGSAADAYERGRPEWPDELLDVVPLDRGATVVDLGAGTGKLTRALARRFARVIAVEPDDSMRAAIDVGEPLAGTAESIPLRDASVGGVFSAEAFHWFNLDRAPLEIARVLQPGGVLALLWTRYEPRNHVVPEELIPPSSSPKHAVFSSGSRRAAFEGAPFAPFQEASLDRPLYRRRWTVSPLLDAARRLTRRAVRDGSLRGRSPRSRTP